MITKLLNGKWKLKRLKTGDVYDAQVPGDITIDLWKAGLYDDPKVSFNYKECAWVLREDFEYILDFEISKEMLAQEKLTLKFLGIDTFAEVYLNGEKLFDAENMFLGYEQDVTAAAKAGKNRLSVVMRSTVVRGESYDASKYFSCFNPYRIFLRKAQCHFGWDWAPDLPGYGIWQDVVLTAGSAARIENVNYRTKTDGSVTFFVTLDTADRREKDLTLRYLLTRSPEGGLESGCYEYAAAAGGQKNFASFRVEEPRLWWCNGMGEPALYPYRIELYENGELLSAEEGKLGIREAEIEELPIGHDKLSFTLKLNGRRVFVKGSNWVPAECFTGTIRDEKYEALVRCAKDGNLNMLRVWGGGMYEKDVFYRLCDENGIMVWQDFMFACADIPEDDPAFVQNALADCRYNLLRLRTHPSIVCWCGGNEKTGTYGKMISHGDYFLDHMLQGVVSTLDKSRPYFRQSPHAYSDIGNDGSSGETHHSVFNDLLNGSFRDYRKELAKQNTSFNSEVAIMGPCCEKSYRAFLKEGELWPTGPVWDDRYRENPYAAIRRTFVDIQKQYAKEMYGDFKNLGDFIAKSMSVHADSLKMEIEYARSQKWNNSGIMNWMFSDIWPTGTWSVIDYYLRPKQAYYGMKRAFAPVLFAFYLSAEGKHVLSGINDTAEKIACTVRYGQKTFAGETLWEKSLGAVLGENSAAALAETDDAQIDKRTDSYLFVRAEADGKEYANTYFPYLYPAPPFASRYTYTEERTENEIALTFRAEEYARHISIDAGDGVLYSDNYFDLEAGEEKRVVLRGAAENAEIRVTDFVKETR